MEGQSHSVHGGTKPLGLRRDNATRYYDGGTKPLRLRRDKQFLIAMTRMLQVNVLGIGPQLEGKQLGVCRVKATRFMEGQDHSVCERTKPLDIWKDKATPFTK